MYVRCVMDAQVIGGDDSGDDNTGEGGGTTPPVTPPNPGTGEDEP